MFCSKIKMRLAFSVRNFPQNEVKRSGGKKKISIDQREKEKGLG